MGSLIYVVQYAWKLFDRTKGWNIYGLEGLFSKSNVCVGQISKNSKLWQKGDHA